MGTLKVLRQRHLSKLSGGTALGSTEAHILSKLCENIRFKKIILWTQIARKNTLERLKSTADVSLYAHNFQKIFGMFTCAIILGRNPLIKKKKATKKEKSREAFPHSWLRGRGAIG